MSRTQPIPMDDPGEDMAEAHYFHTITEVADLMEAHGVDAVMRDLQSVIQQRRQRATHLQVMSLPF